jgi:alkanesulfonate monooxygenase SsuD/methylene tetrahydromethanopterin reductase-like flavin-dependent oxidoreductase (luciferase family)
MKFGLQINEFTWSGGPGSFGATLAGIAQAAESYGFDLIGVAECEELECYTTLGFLAANTSRVKLTAMVTGTHFRNPAVLAKMVTTLDVLSGGRAWFGIGLATTKRRRVVWGFPSLRSNSASRC